MRWDNEDGGELGNGGEEISPGCPVKGMSCDAPCKDYPKCATEHPTLAAFRKIDPECAQAYADCGPINETSESSTPLPSDPSMKATKQ